MFNDVIHYRKFLGQRIEQTSKVQKARNLLAQNEKYIIIILFNVAWQRDMRTIAGEEEALIPWELPPALSLRGGSALTHLSMRFGMKVSHLQVW